MTPELMASYRSILGAWVDSDEKRFGFELLAAIDAERARRVEAIADAKNEIADREMDVAAERTRRVEAEADHADDVHTLEEEREAATARADALAKVCGRLLGDYDLFQGTGMATPRECAVAYERYKVTVEELRQLIVPDAAADSERSEEGKS